MKFRSTSPSQSVPAGTTATQIPEQFVDHPLIAGKYFYTLPVGLLQLLGSNVGAERFDSGLMRLEYSLSEICGDHSLQVGFCDRNVICSVMLSRRPINLTPEQAEFLNLDLSRSGLRERNSLMNERTTALWRQARAYLGWLLTNPEFLGERDALIRSHRAQILQHGFPISTRIDISALPSVSRETEPESLEFVDAVRRLCERWRLAKLNGPLLVEPLQPQLPSLLPAKNAESLGRGVLVFEIPDICRVSAGGTLGDIVHESLGHEVPTVIHLADWMAVVERSNASRGTLKRYERLFVFQHYMRVLYGRHSEVLGRCAAKVRRAIAAFLEQNHTSEGSEEKVPDYEELLRKDNQCLKTQLGSDWMESLEV